MERSVGCTIGRSCMNWRKIPVKNSIIEATSGLFLELATPFYSYFLVSHSNQTLFRKHYDVIGEINLIWRGVEKPTGSFFANSSPAFDFSVLTACFLTHRGKGDKCRILVDGCNIQIQAYDMVQNGKVFIGTAYPEIGRPSRDCDQLYNKRSMTMCKL